ncbi:MAG: HAMP domain-containing histidine kinase [Bacteroidales bacterium]|nr:HAMP domain-containing histidine kinase [Bacteroidales bacterium]
MSCTDDMSEQNKPAKGHQVTVGAEETGTDQLKLAFLRNIFHEIRTPLNAIIGFSTLLGEHYKDDETAKEYIGMLIGSSERLLDTMDKIVEASLLQSGRVTVKKERVNINELTRDIYSKLFQQAVQKGLKLTLRPPFTNEDTYIITDRYKVSQVLQNLVENAIKFTSAGEVEFGFTVSGTLLNFFVHDTGIGIPVDLKEKVFDVFFQADSGPSRLYGGTGLGLSISKAYVEMLGGKIWFTSENGHGTTFWFTVPADR